MDKSDKLTDLVYEDEDVRKSVEKRRDLPDNVGNAQTFIVTKETTGGKAFFWLTIKMKLEWKRTQDTVKMHTR